MTLDPKALEAAYDTCGAGKEAAWAQRIDIRVAIQTYKDVADLVERKLQVPAENLLEGLDKAIAQRDEARRDAEDYLHELADERARSDDAFKQRAALREAIERNRPIMDAYEHVHIELEEGKDWRNIDQGLRASAKPFRSYEVWLAYFQQKFVNGLRDTLNRVCLIDTADLVERIPMEDAVDEYRALADERGRHVAALRAAGETLIRSIGYGSMNTEPLRQALIAPTEAAARYRLVDDEHVVVPVRITEVQRKAALDTTGLLIWLPWYNDFYEAAVRAAPAAKGEAGGGTEPEAEG